MSNTHEAQEYTTPAAELVSSEAALAIVYEAFQSTPEQEREMHQLIAEIGLKVGEVRRLAIAQSDFDLAA